MLYHTDPDVVVFKRFLGNDEAVRRRVLFKFFGLVTSESIDFACVQRFYEFLCFPVEVLRKIGDTVHKPVTHSTRVFQCFTVEGIATADLLSLGKLFERRGILPNLFDNVGVSQHESVSTLFKQVL